jgi:acyl-CoA synthetase (AMP-forming)/AMP-acid ligase II
VLATVAANSIEIPSITLGTLRAGGIVSPANPGYTKAELAYQLKDSGAKAIVTTSVALQNVKKACQQVGIAEQNIILLDDDNGSRGHIKNWKSLLVAQSTASHQPPVISPKTDLAFLVYSSGTTGRPKGVKLSHYNITSNILQLQIGEQGNITWNGSKTSPGIPRAKGQGDVLLSSLPFFHIYGLTVLVLNPIYTGATSIVMSKFHIETFCDMIQKHKVTYAYVVPPIVLLLSKHPSISNYDLSSIRMMNSGAAPLSEELVKSLYKRTGVRVKQGYGLSETSPAAFFQRWEDWESAVGSSGWLIPNMQAKFCTVPGAEGESDGSKELPAGETGELYLRGPNIFLGYHNNDAATKDCLGTDGWFRTGDVGHLDKQGNLFITDRVKELIKYKGFQVPPAELEGYLIDHPSVSDVAVVGFESRFLGTECPRAYIVLAGGMTRASKERRRSIISWLNERVTHHKKLRGGLEFVESIPKSASGKILRRVLKADAKENSEAIDKEIEEGEKHKAKL